VSRVFDGVDVRLFGVRSANGGVAALGVLWVVSGWEGRSRPAEVRGPGHPDALEAGFEVGQDVGGGLGERGGVAGVGRALISPSPPRLTSRRIRVMSGWPADWHERKRGMDCPMCASLGEGDNSHGLVVATLPFAEVRLGLRSRLPGYCVVTWNQRHVAEASELDDHEAAGYWHDVVAVARALEVEFNPLKINLLTLGNWVPHLHTHVVPRYGDDPAPGGPINWYDIFGEDDDDPAVLQERANRIRARLSAP
jgi:diadenosine tetraphosphate (Ap4A) HIT family hydrolase